MHYPLFNQFSFVCSHFKSTLPTHTSVPHTGSISPPSLPVISVFSWLLLCLLGLPLGMFGAKASAREQAKTGREGGWEMETEAGWRHGGQQQ